MIIYAKRQHKRGGGKDRSLPDQIQKPVLIYGNMQYAANVYEYCVKNGCSVAGFVVDDEYWLNDQYLCGRKVESIKTYLEKIENYVLVLGFCNVSRTRELIRNEDLLRTDVYLIYCADDWWKWTPSYIEETTEKFWQLRKSLADTKSIDTLDALTRLKTGIGKFEELLSVAEDNQYFNHLTYEIYSDNEVYVDCGAYNGDTARKYSKFTDGRYKKIFVLEPMQENIKLLKATVAKLHDVELFPVGAWKEKNTLCFEENGSASKAVESDCGSAIDVNSLDNMFLDQNVTFIKMDIEGSEYEALLGARKIIEKCMPKLAICVYHKPTDLINIFMFLRRFRNEEKEYKFFLRHHANDECETVLYAIPATVC